MYKGLRRGALVAAGVVALVVASLGAGQASAETPTTVAKYGWKDIVEYDAKWAAPYGPGEGTRTVVTNSVTVAATPFTTGADFSVFDHLKYIRISNQSFDVPASGSLEMSVDIEAATPGTQPGRVIHGCYGPSGSWQTGQPCAQPWQQATLEGQQAGVVLNMVNFRTGQLFDWFVSGGQVFALIERLPSNVTGSPGVGLDKA